MKNNITGVMTLTAALRLAAWMRQESIDSVVVPELDGVKYHDPVQVEFTWTTTVGPQWRVSPATGNLPPREDWAVAHTEGDALVIRAPKITLRLKRSHLGFIKVAVE